MIYFNNMLAPWQAHDFMTAATEKGHTALMDVSVLHVADLQGASLIWVTLASSASSPIGWHLAIGGSTCLKGQLKEVAWIQLTRRILFLNKKSLDIVNYEAVCTLAKFDQFPYVHCMSPLLEQKTIDAGFKSVFKLSFWVLSNVIWILQVSL